MEALLNCSSKSVKSAAGDTPQPCGPDEKGEMQVSFPVIYIFMVSVSEFVEAVSKVILLILIQFGLRHFQVVPILLHLVKAISSVRLYIPKDLRSLDSRQSVGKSIKVRI